MAASPPRKKGADFRLVSSRARLYEPGEAVRPGKEHDIEREVSRLRAKERCLSIELKEAREQIARMEESVQKSFSRVAQLEKNLSTAEISAKATRLANGQLRKKIRSDCITAKSERQESEDRLGLAQAEAAIREALLEKERREMRLLLAHAQDELRLCREDSEDAVMNAVDARDAAVAVANTFLFHLHLHENAMTKEKDAIEAVRQLREASKETQNLKDQLRETLQENSILNTELFDCKAAHEDAVAQIQTANQSIQLLRQELKRAREVADHASKNCTKLQKEHQELQYDYTQTKEKLKVQRDHSAQRDLHIKNLRDAAEARQAVISALETESNAAHHRSASALRLVAKADNILRSSKHQLADEANRQAAMTLEGMARQTQQARASAREAHKARSKAESLAESLTERCIFLVAERTAAARAELIWREERSLLLTALQNAENKEYTSDADVVAATEALASAQRIRSQLAKSSRTTTTTIHEQYAIHLAALAAQVARQQDQEIISSSLDSTAKKQAVKRYIEAVCAGNKEQMKELRLDGLRLNDEACLSAAHQLSRPEALPRAAEALAVSLTSLERDAPPELTTLFERSTQANNALLNTQAQLPFAHLLTLNLSNNAIGDIGATALASLVVRLAPRLSLLDLSNNRVASAGREALHNEAQANTSVHRVSIATSTNSDQYDIIVGWRCREAGSRAQYNAIAALNLCPSQDTLIIDLRACASKRAHPGITEATLRLVTDTPPMAQAALLASCENTIPKQQASKTAKRNDKPIRKIRPQSAPGFRAPTPSKYPQFTFSTIEDDDSRTSSSYDYKRTYSSRKKTLAPSPHEQPTRLMTLGDRLRQCKSNKIVPTHSFSAQTKATARALGVRCYLPAQFQ